MPIDKEAAYLLGFIRRKRKYVVAINVPVVFMARYVMVLRSATSVRGALEGVGPENRDFFGPFGYSEGITRSTEEPIPKLRTE
jgi:hypothetical protein